MKKSYHQLIGSPDETGIDGFPINPEIIFQDDNDQLGNIIFNGEEVDEDSSQCCVAQVENSILLNGLKKSCTFLVTHVGLIWLVTCYCLFGAVIFELLEHSNEIKVITIYYTRVKNT
jgi:hypothetical protein